MNMAKGNFRHLEFTYISFSIILILDSSKGSMAFQFQTMERGGILMYCNGSNVNKDFFALELVDDYLYLVLDMGSGIQKVNFFMFIHKMF